MRKKRQPLPPIEVLRKLKNAGVENSPKIVHCADDIEELSSLEERVDYLMGIVNKPERPDENMLFFVMYDIESNKVRRYVAKYLIQKGCKRIQKSIFMADLARSDYAEIKNNLAEVQSLYENNDSIILCPVSTDEIKAMKVIGQKLDVDVLMRNKNTLFF